jgi:cytochrome c biogenesis protein CcdA
METLFNEVLSSNILFGLLLAFVAGIFSSFSPCILSSISLIIGYVGGYAGDNKRKAFIYSLTFASGLIITFTILGIISSFIGEILGHLGAWWYLLLGILMIIMGLELLGVIHILPSGGRHISDRKGMIGAFLLGMFGGMFCVSCSAPILVIILALVAEQGKILIGALLLLFYAIGHSSLIVIAGSSIAVTEKLIQSPKTAKIGKIFKIILAILIIIMAIYLFYLGFCGGVELHEH